MACVGSLVATPRMGWEGASCHVCTVGMRVEPLSTAWVASAPKP